MYMYVRTYIHTYTERETDVAAESMLRSCMCICMSVHTYIHTYTERETDVDAQVLYVYMYVRTYIHTYIERETDVAAEDMLRFCMCICMSVHTYILTQRERLM